MTASTRKSKVAGRPSEKPPGPSKPAPKASKSTKAKVDASAPKSRSKSLAVESARPKASPKKASKEVPSPRPSRAARKPEVGIILEGKARQKKALGKLLVSHAQALLEALELPRRELSLVLTGDAEIAALNLEWRDEDKPTDVLSFPMDDAPRGGPRPKTGPLGDIVISVETTSRDAEALGWETADLATFLLVHGVLHLVGHDHGDPEEAAEMRAEEDRLLAVIAPSLTRPPTPY